MPHLHYCDIEGHEWQCNMSSCMCVCGKTMEEGDHTGCPIELLACPEHQEEEHGRTADLLHEIEQYPTVLGCAHEPKTVRLIGAALSRLASRGDEHS